MPFDQRARRILLVRAAVAGQVLFTVAWIAAGLYQGPGFSAARHDISDAGALTAPYAWVWLVPQGISGLSTIVFAIGALRPALRIPGERDAAGAWLLAVSLMGIDDLGDVFFRLDCRAADPGCTPARAMASWHGVAHVAVAIVATIATALTAFTLARRMSRLPAWRDLAPGAVWLGVAFCAGSALYAALDDKWGSGLVQRVLCVLGAAAVIALAARVEALARGGVSART